MKRKSLVILTDTAAVVTVGTALAVTSAANAHAYRRGHRRPQ
jgi:hypothetical protein